MKKTKKYNGEKVVIEETKGKISFNGESDAVMLAMEEYNKNQIKTIVSKLKGRLDLVKTNEDLLKFLDTCIELKRIDNLTPPPFG